MGTFTPVYNRARMVALAQSYSEPEWERFFCDVDMAGLFGEAGLNSSRAETPDRIRDRFDELARAAALDRAYSRKAGKFIYAACQNDNSPGRWTERAALVEFTRHLYRERKAGAQDVWVYSPARDYVSDVFDELNTDDAAAKKKLGYEEEVFTSTERELMCDALGIARKVAMDAEIKLSQRSEQTKAVVQRWFIDDSSTGRLDEAMNRLLTGMKLIVAACSSTTLVFTDYLDWRGQRNKFFAGAIRGGEGGNFPVLYIEGAFTKMVGLKNKLWLCAETVIHEFSHHELRTRDHRYDTGGLRPGRSFPYATAIENADSWGYFTMDLAGYLTEGERLRTLGSLT